MEEEIHDETEDLGKGARDWLEYILADEAAENPPADNSKEPSEEEVQSDEEYVPEVGCSHALTDRSAQIPRRTCTRHNPAAGVWCANMVSSTWQS